MSTWEIVAVAIDSLSLLVNRNIKVNVVDVLDKRNEEAINECVGGMIEMYTQLSAEEKLPEVDWSRIRSIDFQESLRHRNNLSTRIPKLECTLCGDFEEHVSLQQRRPRDRELIGCE